MGMEERRMVKKREEGSGNEWGEESCERKRERERE